MREKAKITTANEKYCTIEIERKSACESCKMCTFPNDEKKLNIELVNSLNCKTGDIVDVEISNSIVLVASFVTYMIPLIFMVLFLAVSSLVTNNQIIAVISATIGLVLGFVVVIQISKILKKNKKFDIEIVKIYSNEENKND